MKIIENLIQNVLNEMDRDLLARLAMEPKLIISDYFKNEITGIKIGNQLDKINEKVFLIDQFMTRKDPGSLKNLLQNLANN